MECTAGYNILHNVGGGGRVVLARGVRHSAPVSGEVNLLWAEAGMVRQVCYNMHK